MALTREQLWAVRLRDARPAIATLLASSHTWSKPALEELLAERRTEWRFPNTLTLESVCDYLVKTRLLRKVVLAKRDSTSQRTSYPSEIILFADQEATDMDIALSLRSKSHLSHLSAAFVHGLTDVLPRQVFTNREQSPKLSGDTGPLQQERVDSAFSKPARTTSNVYVFGDREVVLLSGQHTGGTDVETATGPDGREYPVTSLERTLIECVVRPTYAGGIHEVLSMYEAARDRLNARRLRGVLDLLGLKYPYRQSVGFILERTGYSARQVSLFETPAFEVDFYLDYDMAEREYSARWRLYHPKSL